VLVVKHRVQGRYRQVLVPVDLGEMSEVALSTAITLAPSASVHVFHALSTHPAARLRADVSPSLVREYEDRDRQQGMQRLRSMVASLHHPRVGVSVDHGHPAQLTLDKQNKMLADLVVIGKNGRSAVLDFLLGSVANRALAETNCDVLLIPAASVRRRVGGSGPATGRHRVDPLFAPIHRRRPS
jgi:nucleotide-binding universal stress UspA family protein